MSNRIVAAAICAGFLSAFQALPAQAQVRSIQARNIQAQSNQNHVVSVTRAGMAFAKPDLGILAMEIRSSAPLVDEAASDNAQKAKAIESALAALGYAPENYKLTSVSFGRPGGPFYGPNQPAGAGYEASQFVYVFFEGPDLSDSAKLSEKAAAAIEALRKAGAVPRVPDAPYRPQAEPAMIVYTVKDSETYERQALRQAVERARDAAKDVARTMQVQLAGLESVRTGALARGYPMMSGLAPLYGLPYRFYSATSDEVQISANATVSYSIK